MKKKLSLLLTLALTVSLAACGGQESTAPSESAQPTQAVAEELTFVYQDCALPMNAAFGPLLETIGEPATYFEAASCAFEGLDKTYTYDSVEIITYPDEEEDYISSIRILNDGVSTPEGITIGSTQAEVVAAYGEEYTDFGNQYTYAKEDTELSFLFEGDVVTSVEYLAINDLLG